MGWAVVLALAAGPPSAVVTSVPAATIVATDSPRRAPCDGFRRNGVTKIILLAPRYSVVCPWRPRACHGQRTSNGFTGRRRRRFIKAQRIPKSFTLKGLGGSGRLTRMTTHLPREALTPTTRLTAETASARRPRPSEGSLMSGRDHGLRERADRTAAPGRFRR